MQQLEKQYEKVYLVRNEREFKLYSFKEGNRFEPDYVLFLRKKKEAQEGAFNQIQIFIEPKGEHLMEKDKWKEDFLKEIEGLDIPAEVLSDGNGYQIWGIPFYNRSKGLNEFATAFRHAAGMDEKVD